MTEGFEAFAPFREAFEALDPDRFPGSHIEKRIQDGDWRCWGTDKAAIIAEIVTYPSGLCDVHGVAATGELEAIKALIPLAEQWGRENGCGRAVISSRPGWERVLPDYQIHQVSVRKEL